MEYVILVDSNDNEIGKMEKLEAHKRAKLHRAFSVMLFNSRGELLIHKRALKKYHSGGLWTNTCCSHPRPGEDIQMAAKRRLMEEMGINTETQFLYKFIYKVNLNDSLTEHEMDYVFIGQFDGSPEINKEEVADWRYESLDRLKEDIDHNPDNYTHWFKLIVANLDNHLAKIPV